MSRSWPFHQRRQGGENRLDIAAGPQAEHGAAVVQEVELDVASTTNELLIALRLVPGRRKVAPHQLRIDIQERAADVLDKSKVRVPISRIVPVEENAANAARLAAMLEIEILVAPSLVLLVRRNARMRFAGRPHGGVKGLRVRVLRRAAHREHRSKVGAAAKPGSAGYDEARVQVHGRRMRAPEMCNQ